MDDSISVPGVTIRTMSRSTSPFAWAGSSICSQIATLYPFAMSRAIYASEEWYGTPHMGMRSSGFSVDLSRDVSVRSSSSDAVLASESNIS